MTLEEMRAVFYGLVFGSGFVIAICGLTWLFGRRRRTYR